MHDVTCEFACAEGCPETIRANVLEVREVCPQFSVMTTFSHLCDVIDGIIFSLSLSTTMDHLISLLTLFKEFLLQYTQYMTFLPNLSQTP